MLEIIFVSLGWSVGCWVLREYGTLTCYIIDLIVVCIKSMVWDEFIFFVKLLHQ